MIEERRRRLSAADAARVGMARARRANRLAGWLLARCPELALAALALLGAALFWAAQGGPAAMVGAFAAAWFLGLALAAAPPAGAPTERLPPRGAPLAGRDGAALRAMVEEIAEVVGAEPPARIVVTDELELCLAPFRADAADLIELRIGAPFLVAMDRAAFRAALAHEMAHRARGDDVANVGAVFAVQRLRRLSAGRESMIVAFLLAAPAAALADMLTLLHRRRRRAQEFAADAAAAALAGGPNLARALALVERAAGLLVDIDYATADPAMRLSRLDARLAMTERPLPEAASFADSDPQLWLEEESGSEHPSAASRLKRLGLAQAPARRLGPDAASLLDPRRRPPRY